MVRCEWAWQLKLIDRNWFTAVISTKKRISVLSSACYLFSFCRPCAGHAVAMFHDSEMSLVRGSTVLLAYSLSWYMVAIPDPRILCLWFRPLLDLSRALQTRITRILEELIYRGRSRESSIIVNLKMTFVFWHIR